MMDGGQIETRQGVVVGMDDGACQAAIEVQRGARTGGHGAFARHHQQLNQCVRGAMNGCALDGALSGVRGDGEAEAEDGDEHRLFNEGTARATAHDEAG